MEDAIRSSDIGQVAGGEACTMLWSADTRPAYIFFLTCVPEKIYPILLMPSRGIYIF
jgi:hypothetical protein